MKTTSVSFPQFSEPMPVAGSPGKVRQYCYGFVFGKMLLEEITYDAYSSSREKIALQTEASLRWDEQLRNHAAKKETDLR